MTCRIHECTDLTSSWRHIQARFRTALIGNTQQRCLGTVELFYTELWFELKSATLRR
jgi:hypothetical protein